MNTLPLITIGITCYNASNTITRAIESAVAQTWKETEIIIVDDYSSDDSVATIKNSIIDAQTGTIICHSVNQGPAASRNTIISQANGEFVVFFDDDDESSPTRLTDQYNAIIHYEKMTGSMFIANYAAGVRVYPNGHIKELPAIGSRGHEVPHGSGIADYLLFYGTKDRWFYGSGVPTCALMARKSVFDFVGCFDSNLKRVEDVDFAIRLALKSGYFTGTQKRLFTQHATDGPDKSYDKNLEAETALAQKHCQYLTKINRYYYALHWPKLRYNHFTKRYVQFTKELLGLLIRHPIAVTKHLLTTGPLRLLHEKKINRIIIEND